MQQDRKRKNDLHPTLGLIIFCMVALTLADAVDNSQKFPSPEQSVKPASQPAVLPNIQGRPSSSATPVQGKARNFYVYRFLDKIVGSVRPPVPGTPGPVEALTRIQYPGVDATFYNLDDGFIVPHSVVEENGFYELAIQLVPDTRQSNSSPTFDDWPTPGQRPRPCSPSPESPEADNGNLGGKVWPPHHQGKPYVLVPTNPYHAQHHDGNPASSMGHSRSRPASNHPTHVGSKGKERRVVFSEGEESAEEEEDSTADDSQDEDFIPEQDQTQDGIGDEGDLDCEPMASSDPIENTEESFGTGVDDEPMAIDDNGPPRKSTVQAGHGGGRADGDDDAETQGDVETLEVPVEWKHKGGRPSKEFIRKAAAVGESFNTEIEHLMKTFKVSLKVAHVATGLQPRIIETRETSSWNAHQRVYKIEYPKEAGESVIQPRSLLLAIGEFKARSRLHYMLHVKPLTKDEKVKFREDCEEFIMEYFFKTEDNDLKASSPAKRVEAACKALQKLAQMISRADGEIQSFGGVNYVGPDKAGRAAGGGTFISSDTVLRAIQIFNIGTQAIMLKTGDFLQAVVSQRGMAHNLEGGRATTANTNEVDRPARRGCDKEPASTQGGNQAQEEATEEPSHVTCFNQSDPRKRARSYLGLTYNKVDPQRTTVDWLGLLRNSLTGQFRLENWCFTPYPGQDGFSAGKITLKQWQAVGKLLTADDFHPKHGGQHAKAPRFVPWTKVAFSLRLAPEEKKLEKGSAKYYEIPIVVSHTGQILLTARQAEERSADLTLDNFEMDEGEVNGASPPQLEMRREAVTLSTGASEGYTRNPQTGPGDVVPTMTRPLEDPVTVRPQPRPRRIQSRAAKEGKTSSHAVPQLDLTLAPDTIPAPTTAANLGYIGNASLSQEKENYRFPFAHSATRAFYADSKLAPPSSRGLPKQQSKASTHHKAQKSPVAGPSGRHPERTMSATFKQSGGASVSRKTGR
ncbi:hypothetical protein CVT26_001346 [Gymnopilus dilepis]|uniref:Uncharacterized protein n=1 Tax=Gymnopilus dilepis TaxID=231916 RepID=A0A409YUR6_9AGAR|nr:hypothetical protein CVT26_001346 [Gymnopilus dilepis]